MSTPDPQRNQIRFIVSMVTFLGALAMVSGTVLTFKGYNAELLVGGGVGAISGLLGMLSVSKPNQPQQDVSITGPPTEVKLTTPEPKQP